LFSYVIQMADQQPSDDDLTLTKPKKPRSEAQKAATEKMRATLAEKQLSGKLSNNEEKKLFLKAVKDKLNNAPPPPTPIETDGEESDDPEPVPAPISKKAKKEEPITAIIKEKAKPKPKAKIIEKVEEVESDDDEPEEVIVIKRQKKKPKKKTIIIEESSDDDAEDDEDVPVPAKPAVRATRSQQHKKSKILVQQAQQQMRDYDMIF